MNVFELYRRAQWIISFVVCNIVVIVYEVGGPNFLKISLNIVYLRLRRLHLESAEFIKDVSRESQINGGVGIYESNYTCELALLRQRGNLNILQANVKVLRH